MNNVSLWLKEDVEFLVILLLLPLNNWKEFKMSVSAVSFILGYLNPNSTWTAILDEGEQDANDTTRIYASYVLILFIFIITRYVYYCRGFQ